MSEEEQEKIYELLFKDTKNKLEETIEEQQNKIVSLQKEIKLMKSININDNYISKDKIRERIKMNEELIKKPSKWKYTENEIRNFKIENLCLKELLEE